MLCGQSPQNIYGLKERVYHKHEIWKGLPALARFCPALAELPGDQQKTHSLIYTLGAQAEKTRKPEEERSSTQLWLRKFEDGQTSTITAQNTKTEEGRKGGAGGANYRLSYSWKSCKMISVHEGRSLKQPATAAGQSLSTPPSMEGTINVTLCHTLNSFHMQSALSTSWTTPLLQNS